MILSIFFCCHYSFSSSLPTTYPTPYPMAYPVTPFEILNVQKLLKDQKWEMAALSLKELYQRDKRNLSLLFDLSEVLVRLGKRFEAFDLLQKALASTDLKISQKKQIHSRFQILSQIFLSNAVAQSFYDSVKLLETKKYKLAQEKLKQILVKEPDHVLILVRLAQSEILAHHPKKAIPYLKRALQLTPFEPWILAWLGRTLSLVGEREEGYSFLEKSFKDIPSSELVATWLAEGFVFNKKPMEALSLLDGFYRKYPLSLKVLFYSIQLRVQYLASDGPSRLKAAQDFKFLLKQLSRTDFLKIYPSQLVSCYSLNFGLYQTPEEFRTELQRETEELLKKYSYLAPF